MEMLEKNIECPYCGETLDVLVDESESGQSYIEDCQVCCRPIVFGVTVEPEGNTVVNVKAENE